MILVLTILFSFGINVSAKDIDSDEIEWQYTVYADETCQEIVETGTIPKIATRYSWGGITLLNGQTCTFTPSHSNAGLYAEKGTVMTIRWSLNRAAKYRAMVYGYNNISNQYETTRNNSSGFSANWTVPAGDYYRGKMMNLSSDAFTITSFSIDF